MNRNTYFVIRNTNPQSGFIALMSTIIISSVLLIITVALNMSGFLGRSNILDSQLKETSLSLAEACGDTAILNIANDPAYNPTNQDVVIGSDKCTIVSVQDDVPLAGQKTIKTKATPSNSNSVTNLKIVIDSTSFAIVSWEEVANF